jgi:hypothetical protein
MEPTELMPAQHKVLCQYHTTKKKEEGNLKGALGIILIEGAATLLPTLTMQLHSWPHPVAANEVAGEVWQRRIRFNRTD